MTRCDFLAVLMAASRFFFCAFGFLPWLLALILAFVPASHDHSWNVLASTALGYTRAAVRRLGFTHHVGQDSGSEGQNHDGGQLGTAPGRRPPRRASNSERKYAARAYIKGSMG